MSAASWATFHVELLRERVGKRGWDGFIPLDEEEIAQARAWLCWRAVAIGDEEMSEAVARAQRAQERLLRDHLAWEHGVDHGPHSLAIHVAARLLDALADALIAPFAPLERAEVAQLWEEQRLQLLEGAEAA